MSDGEFKPLSGRGAKPAEQQPEVIGLDMASPGSDQTVYVLTVPTGTTKAAMDDVKAQLRRELGASAKVVVLTDGLHLSVIRKDKDHG